MAQNFPGPYEVRIFYVVSLREHVAKLNVTPSSEPSPGDPFTSISCLDRNGSPRVLSVQVGLLVDEMDNWLNSTDADILRAELWKYEPESFDSSFVSTYDLSVAGASATATVPASQIIWTFRTGAGGSMRFTMLDVVTPPGVSVYPPYGGITASMAALFLDDTTVFHARDDSHPFANSGFHPGQNERLFKRIYRT